MLPVLSRQCLFVVRFDPKNKYKQE